MITRRSIHTILATIAMCAAAVATLVAQDIETPPVGKIDLASEPRGAEVFLGDSLLGRTPLRIDVRIADSVRAYWPSRTAWNAQVRTLPARPLAASEGVVLLRFARRVQLRSLPHGARVFRGDTLIGMTPLFLDPEEGPVRVEALGFEGKDFDPATAERGEALVTLEPHPGMEASAVEMRTAALRLPSTTILLSAGVGLAAGVAAVIFKQKADALYDDYRSSGDDALLSQTKKYDIYAGISLALLQVGLGYVIYLILDE